LIIESAKEGRVLRGLLIIESAKEGRVLKRIIND
jgi:hypothetical protein